MEKLEGKKPVEACLHAPQSSKVSSNCSSRDWHLTMVFGRGIRAWDYFNYNIAWPAINLID